MKKVALTGSALAVLLLSNTVMAADFHALAAVQTAPAPIEDKELSVIEGGAICHFQTGGGVGGFTVCDAVVAWPLIKLTPIASYTAANELPITNGHFLQVTK